MPDTITLIGKRTSATVFCSHLIAIKRSVLFLSIFGPSQEVRAFAQLLVSGEADLTTEKHRIMKTTLGGELSMIPKMDHGYTALYVIPPLTSGVVIGEDEDACFDTYSRILDQLHFVYRDWYEAIFGLSTEIPPLIGNKKCYYTVPNPAHEVVQLVKYGQHGFPPPTANLELQVVSPSQ